MCVVGGGHRAGKSGCETGPSTMSKSLHKVALRGPEHGVVTGRKVVPEAVFFNIKMGHNIGVQVPIRADKARALWSIPRGGAGLRNTRETCQNGPK